jgi:hypothetical protein
LLSIEKREAWEREEDKRLEALLLEGLDTGDEVKVDRRFWKNVKTEVSSPVKKLRKRA